MKNWFESATLIEEATVEVGFLLFSNFYYGPDRYPDIAKRKEVEPLSVPTFPRSAERLATTSEAEPYVDELARYYTDVVRLSRKYGKTFDQVRQYFWLRLTISNPENGFNVSFPWYDTLSEMETLLAALSDPPTSGDIHWDRDQSWELEVDAYNDMLYIREWDPDYEDVHVIGKLPLLALASSSQATLARAKKIIAFLSEALTEDAWTNYKTSIDFSKLSIPRQA